MNFVVCLYLKWGFGNVLYCYEIDDGYEICKVICRLGYLFFFGNFFLLEYKCGKNILYIWNGKLFVCGSMYD